jgi:hypothetical protein
VETVAVEVVVSTASVEAAVIAISRSAVVEAPVIE